MKVIQVERDMVGGGCITKNLDDVVEELREAIELNEFPEKIIITIFDLDEEKYEKTPRWDNVRFVDPKREMHTKIETITWNKLPGVKPHESDSMILFHHNSDGVYADWFIDGMDLTNILAWAELPKGWRNGH